MHKNFSILCLVLEEVRFGTYVNARRLENKIRRHCQHHDQIKDQSHDMIADISDAQGQRY